MKKFRIISTLVSLALACGTASAVQAQAQARAPAEIQREYNQFISGFRAAVQSNDRAAVTALARFPFEWMEVHDAASFQRSVYGRIFTQRVRNCVARARGVYDRDPQGNHTFSIFCNEHIFYFNRTPDGFRFAGIHVND